MAVPAKKSFLPNLTILRRKSALRCPDCAVWMTPYSCESVIVDKCPECEGIWFDHGELSVFRESLAHFDLSKIKILERPDPEAKLIFSSCPRCATCLEEFTYSYNTQVHLKRCPKCSGIWSPLGQTINLIELAKISQAIAPDIRALAGDFVQAQKEDGNWKALGRAGKELSRGPTFGNYIAPSVVLPLHDNIARAGYPVITTVILLACLFILIYSGPNAINTWGMKPVEVLGLEKVYTLVTSVFIHAGFSHFIGNALYLWIFGPSVEDRVGRIRYLFLFLVSGVVGNLVMTVALPNLQIPCVGASGAISGVLGSYFYLFPSATISMVLLGSIIELPAWIFLGVWITYQIIWAKFDQTLAVTNIGWYAHVGGFISGFLVTRTLVKLGLLQRPQLGNAHGKAQSVSPIS